MSDYQLQIGLYLHGVACSGRTYAEHPLGGSESSCILLAEELSKIGQTVTVFSYGDEESYGDQMRVDYNGVRYLRLPEMWGQLGHEDFDIFLIERDHNKLVDPLIRSRQLGLLNHDVCSNGESLMANLYGTDFIYCLSQWQEQQYENKAPELRGKINVLGNPIDVEGLLAVKDRVAAMGNRLDRASGKFDNPTFVYNSRPERGLLLLLKYIWPEILQVYPDAELKVCFYSVEKERLQPEMLALHETCYELMKTVPHVEYLGGLKKDDLYELIARSSCVLYPTIFCEVFNISAVEAQILGTPYLTTNAFAMKETVINKSHLVFPYEVLNTAFYRTMCNATVHDTFITPRVEKVIRDCVERPKSLQNAMDNAALVLTQRYDKKVIAQRFLNDCQERFERRWKAKGSRIVYNLMYHSDHIAARYALQNCVEDEKLNEINERMLALHHTEPERYGAMVDHDEEMITGLPERMEKALTYIKAFVGDRPFTFQDCCCGGGRMLYHVIKTFGKQAKVRGFDFSETLIQRTFELLKSHFGLPDSHFLEHGDMYEIEPDVQADIVFFGEALEHQQDCVKALTAVDAWCRPGGLIILTMPYGPWEAISNEFDHHPDHVQHYEKRDLEEILKNQMYTMELVQRQRSPKDGAPTAQWVITIGKQDEPKPYYYPNYQRKFETTRPYVKVGMCAIMKDEEDNVARFLKPFLGRVEHLVLYDTGSGDETIEIAAKLLYDGETGYKNFEETDERDDEEHQRRLGIPAKKSHLLVQGYWNDNFSAARNRALDYLLEYDIDIVVWADLDEVITNPYRIKKYVGKGDLEIYNGFRVVQYQFMADQIQNTRDFPIRIFRADKGYRWFGCVTGDTLIDCPRDLSEYPDGIPIKDLVGQSGFYTYVYSTQKKEFALRPVKWVRKTRRNAPVYRVVWKDGYTNTFGELKLTADHPVLLMNGNWLEAQNLRVGDSLRPLRRNYKIYKPYTAINVRPNVHTMEHKFIYSKLFGHIPDGYHVHHDDHNRYNNDPDNLILLTVADHISHHHTNKKVSMLTKLRIRRNHADVSGKNNPIFGTERGKETKKKIGEKSIERFGDPKWRAQWEESIRNKPSRKGHPWSQARRDAYERSKESESNHKVVSVEFWGYEDVYNMEVEGIHNYVANEIVVHNCVHEHAQKTLNEDIWPLLMIPPEDMQFLHYGFPLESIRRDKALNRNFALLDKDREVNPTRQLGVVLKFRDIIHVVGYYLERHDTPSPRHIEQLNWILEQYEKYEFGNVKHPLHALAFMFQQNVLQIFGERHLMCRSGQVPIQIAQRLVGSHGPVNDIGEPTTRWFALTEELGNYLHQQEKKLVGDLSKVPRYFEWE